MKKGFTLIELLIVVAIIAILAAIAIPNFLQAQTRAKVSRAESDMRSIATAIESYYIDHNMYPAYSIDQEINLAEFDDDTVEFATFIAHNRDDDSMRAHSITTPTAYLTSIPRDPFGRQDSPYRFFSCFRGRGMDRDDNPNSDPFAQDTGWILVSFGPNTNFPEGDIVLLGSGTGPDNNAAGWDTLNFGSDPPELAFTYTATGYDNMTRVNGTHLRSITNATYDPTNGTISSGDIWRARQ